jgi:5-methylcytosine-specific restriction endonuclease McrBC regulatory subunit McrC
MRICPLRATSGWIVTDFDLGKVAQAIEAIDNALRTRRAALLILNHEEFESNDEAFFLQLRRDCHPMQLATQNLIGAVRVHMPPEALTFFVRSRFEQTDGTDPFLHRMLVQVMGLHLMPWSAQMSTHSQDRLLEWFLVLLWSMALKQAYRHGLWRQYLWQHQNASRFRGQLDLGEHLRHNTPFQGRIASRYREFTADNPLNRLILAALLVVAARYPSFVDATLKEIRRALLQVVPLPSHSEVWQQLVHIPPVHHPLLLTYETVRKLSVQLLRLHEVTPALSEGEYAVQGLVFDVALLFESYIRQLLKRLGEGWTLKPKQKVRLFQDHGDMHIIPDYVLSKANTCVTQRGVLDAKYKRWDFHEAYRADMYQVLAYGYQMQADFVGVIHPGHPSQAEESRALGARTWSHRFLRLPFPVWKYEYTQDWVQVEASFLHTLTERLLASDEDTLSPA